MKKDQAEKEYGFRLYQGGIVPGDKVRVVKIEDTDVEACCGTHCDNTSEVGWIKVLKSSRISDGIVRLYFVTGEKAMERLNNERKILNTLSDLWGVSQAEIVKTAERFFRDAKRLDDEVREANRKVLNLQMRYAIDSDKKSCVISTDEQAPTIYVSFAPAFAAEFKAKSKSVVVVSPTFLYALCCNDAVIPQDKLKEILAKTNQKSDLKTRNSLEFEGEKKKKVKTEGIMQILFTGKIEVKEVLQFLESQGILEVRI